MKEMKLKLLAAYNELCNLLRGGRRHIIKTSRNARRGERTLRDCWSVISFEIRQALCVYHRLAMYRYYRRPIIHASIAPELAGAHHHYLSIAADAHRSI